MTPAERRVAPAALAVLLLSALDETIVVTAMPRIVEELRGMSMYAWVMTAYMLTSTITLPIYGKLSDLYGRKPILVIGVVLFLIGSTLCGASGEFGALPGLGSGMMQLIAFRALQGLGAGALLAVSFAIMADSHPSRERGRLLDAFGLVFALATVVGPFIGGFFTDHGTVMLLDHEVAGWRWVFYVNLPLGVLALFMILHCKPVVRPGSGGGVDHRLFGNRAFRITALASFIMSMVSLGVVTFMPLYMQVVQGISATQSGLALLPLLAGMVVSSIVCTRLGTHTGRYKPLMIGGGILLVCGVMALISIGPDTSVADLAWRLALTGIGLGPAQTLSSLVIQNSVPPAQVCAAIRTNQFSQQLGATVGVAIFGVFVTHGLMIELPKHVPLLPGTSEHRLDLEQAQSQAMDAQAIRKRVTQALDERYALVERAYHEDPLAVDEIVGDPRMPEEIRASLRNGGVRSEVRRQLVERAQEVEAELKSGEAGRDRLLQDPELPPGVKRQLANIPVRALRDPELLAGVAHLFRDAILAKENALVASTVQQTLLTVRAALTVYGNQLARSTQRGMKVAFATAIAHMLERSLWIVGLAVVIVLFIPEPPLRSLAQPSDD